MSEELTEESVAALFATGGVNSPEALAQRRCLASRGDSTAQGPQVDYPSLSPFVRLSRQHAQRSQPGGLNASKELAQRTRVASHGDSTSPDPLVEYYYSMSPFARLSRQHAQASLSGRLDASQAPPQRDSVPPRSDNTLHAPLVDYSSLSPFVCLSRQLAQTAQPGGLDAPHGLAQRTSVACRGDNMPHAPHVDSSGLSPFIHISRLQAQPSKQRAAVVVGETLEEEARQLAACLARRTKLGGAAVNAAAGSVVQLISDAAVAESPLLRSVSSLQLQPASVEGAADVRLLSSMEAQQPGSDAGLSALGTPEQRRPQQQAWTQRFCDSRLEQRFRLYQARMLGTVDFVASIMALLGFIASGFTPVPVFRMAPFTWPLVVVLPLLLVIFTGWAPAQWYRRHREVIFMCVLTAMSAVARHIIWPFWIATMDAQALRSPANILRLSGSSGSIILHSGLRVRLRTLLLYSLLVACFNMQPVRLMANAYDAAGVASWACVMFWGALWHLTAGTLLPVLVTSFMERRERCQFLKEEAAAALPKAKQL